MIIYYHVRRKTSSRTISLYVSHERRHMRPTSDTRSLTFPVHDLYRAVRRFRLPRCVTVFVSKSFLWRILGGFQKIPRRPLHENKNPVVRPNDIFHPIAKTCLCAGHRSNTRLPDDLVSDVLN